MSYEIMNKTHPNKKFASKEAIPWFVRVIFLVLVEQQRPLVTRNNDVAICKLLAHPKTNSVSHVQRMKRGPKELALHPYS
jgi:hypothetical protein